MNGSEQKRIFAGLELSRMEKCMARMQIKLDTVREKLADDSVRSEGSINALKSSENTLLAAIDKYTAKINKLRIFLGDDVLDNVAGDTKPIPTPTKSIESTPIVEEIAVNDVIEIDGAEFKIVEKGYKVAKIGKEGNVTKQIKYVKEEDIK